MRVYVRSLKRLFISGKVTAEQLQALVVVESNCTGTDIAQAEYTYIVEVK